MAPKRESSLYITVVSGGTLCHAPGMDLHDACAAGDVASTVALLNLGEDASARREEDGATPLTLASRLGNAELAELLLSRGASANAIGLKGKTPLWWAATVDRKGGAGDGEKLCQILLAEIPSTSFTACSESQSQFDPGN